MRNSAEASLNPTKTIQLQQQSRIPTVKKYKCDNNPTATIINNPTTTLFIRLFLMVIRWPLALFYLRNLYLFFVTMMIVDYKGLQICSSKLQYTLHLKKLCSAFNMYCFSYSHVAGWRKLFPMYKNQTIFIVVEVVVCYE